MLKALDLVDFPLPNGSRVNMMPIIMGDPESLPAYLHGYLPIIEACNLRQGSTVYLTVTESIILKGQVQRRGGIHTEAFRAGTCNFGGNFGGSEKAVPWGGWGSTEGLYMASTDGQTRMWNYETQDVDHHGGVLADISHVESFVCDPKRLYWLTDRVPHEALPSLTGGIRQFFRLVSENVSVWYAQHNTPNPLGVPPGAPIESRSKFQ